MDLHLFVTQFNFHLIRSIISRLGVLADLRGFGGLDVVLSIRSKPPPGIWG